MCIPSPRIPAKLDKRVDRDLLSAYLCEDRQWRRIFRIRYARKMKSLVKHGVFFRQDKRFDESFWDAVVSANT